MDPRARSAPPTAPRWARTLGRLPLVGRIVRPWLARRGFLRPAGGGPGDDGSAGVREPRRPAPAPPALAASADPDRADSGGTSR